MVCYKFKMFALEVKGKLAWKNGDLKLEKWFVNIVKSLILPLHYY